MALDATRSLYDDLAVRISQNPSFTRDLEDLHRIDIGSTLTWASLRLPDFDDQRVARLAEAAAALACSGDDTHKALAYRIMYMLVAHYFMDHPGVASLARLVFARVGNLPAEVMLPSAKEAPQLPVVLGVESSWKRLQNEFQIGGQKHVLTDFQAGVMSRLRQSVSISLSAPTSAGKSFMLIQFLLDRFSSASGPYVAAVIVPTRALIRQFRLDAERDFRTAGISGVSVITSTVAAKHEVGGRVLYILTQERLQFLLYHSQNPIPIDLLVVDEAQKVDDDGRGVVLESTILEVLRQSPRVQVVFLAPLAKNPEVLLQRFQVLRGESIRTDLSPVSQNIFDLSITGRGITLKLLSPTQLELLSNFPLPHPFQLGNGPKLLAFAAHRFAGDNPSIVFCNRPADTEAVAQALLSYSQPATSPRVLAFVSFLSQYVHDDYNLIDFLKNGIGVHYGDMPEVVRTYVEELFQSREIRFLCCTSTLLEGVNLPAKNIFIHKPRQGERPMDKAGFWNLAGRAGRLRKDFAGNVFCINQHDWSNRVDDRSRTYELRSALGRTLADEKFAEYVTRQSVDSTAPARFQQAVSFLVPRVMEHGKSAVTDQLRRRGMDNLLPLGRLDLIMDGIDKLTESVRLPSQLLKHNSGVDPRRIEGLRRYLAGLPKSELFGLVPVHPRRNQFYDHLLRMFRIIDRHLVGVTNNSYRYFTLLGFRWVTESALSEIIRRKVEHDRTHGKKAEPNPKRFVNLCIREVLSDLNDKIRFEYVKYLTCYIDVLKTVLPEDGFPEDTDFDLPGYLEVGACRPTTLTFLNMGLSRMTAIILSNYAGTAGDATSWLRENRDTLLSLLPEPCAREVQALVFGDQD